jgi:hypothetical protein
MKKMNDIFTSTGQRSVRNDLILVAPLISKLSDSEWSATFQIKFDARDPLKDKQITGTAKPHMACPKG